MTAAERAHDHLCDALEAFCEWGWVSRAADRAVESLMADPALLVDLAIEAGALEHARNHPPLFRRTTQENDQ